MYYMKKFIPYAMRIATPFARDERGVTALEYGLIAALIAGVIIAAVTLLGTNLNTTFSHLAASAAH
jgi:pilus assembly protein Flp/PilA